MPTPSDKYAPVPFFSSEKKREEFEAKLARMTAVAHAMGKACAEDRDTRIVNAVFPEALLTPVAEDPAPVEYHEVEFIAVDRPSGCVVQHGPAVQGTTFRAGDAVRHVPSKETWLLAADERDGEVVCAGWPESIAKAKDCILVRRSDDEARLHMLKSVAESCGDQMRGSWAKQDLVK